MQEQLISFETAKLAKEKGFKLSLNDFTCPGSGKTTKKPNVRYWYSNFVHHLKLPIDFYATDENGEILEPFMPAPTQSLLAKWLREEHRLIVIISYQYEHDSTPYQFWIYKDGDSLPINEWIHDYNSYEEALEKGLYEALKLI